MTPYRSSGARWPRWALKASAPTHPRPRAGWNAPTACCRIACSRPCASRALIPSIRPMPGCRNSWTATTPASPLRGPGRPCSLPDDRRCPAPTDSVQSLSAQAVEHPHLSIPLHPVASASDFGRAGLARRRGHRARALRSFLRSALARHFVAVLNAAETTRRTTPTGTQGSLGHPTQAINRQATTPIILGKPPACEYRVLEPLSGSATTAIVGFDPALGKAVEFV